jgi:hypothetical protein
MTTTNKPNSHITICNNAGQNLTVVHHHLIDYAKTGSIHEDIADLFSLERFDSDGKIKILVDFSDD